MSRWTKIFRQLNRLPEVARCSALTSQWWPLASAYAGLKKLRLPYTVRFSGGGETVITDFFDLATFWPIFFTPAYPVSRNDKVIIDAGANVGMFTLYAARQAPQAKIVAIEPFPTTFDRLKQTIEINHLSSVTCLNVALGKEAGQAIMPTTEMGSQFRQVVTGEDGRPGIPVPVVGLGEMLDQQGLDQVDLLKMDIEGGEYPTLLNATPEALRRIQRICLEYHPSPDIHSSLERLASHLENSGFQRTFARDDGEGYGMARFVRQ